VSAPATPGRREATKASNRAAILAAGREVFAELGYGAATVRDIIRRTDLASGTFYNYFPDKEAVFRAILAESATEMRARVRAARREAASIEHFVEDAYRAYFSFCSEDPSTFALMRRNAGTIRAFRDDPSMLAALDELHEDLEEAMARGDLPAVDLDYLTAAMAGVALELAMLMVDRDPVDVDGATEFATRLFLAALGPG
jgi:AcrR family transcriptional regulator